jgi:hypothetical protein
MVKLGPRSVRRLVPVGGWVRTPVVNGPCPALLRPTQEKLMNAKMDAFIAEIVRIIDFNLLEQYPLFRTFWRANRMHLILASLKRRDIARAERRGDALYWLPSRRLESRVGVKHRGIRDEFERTDTIGFSTDAQEFDQILRANHKAIEKVALHVVRCFEMYKLGLLEYRGKEDGFLRFKSSSIRTEVSKKARKAADFVKGRVPRYSFRAPVELF